MITAEQLKTERFDVMTINDREVLFTSDRIDRAVLPQGVYSYDIRGSDNGDDFASIEPRVLVNHVGTILTKEKIPMENGDYTEIVEWGFDGEQTTLDEWIINNDKSR